ncbi:MAG TPA: hypothetical protein P5081_13475 [Phycisphaerae bacterium]|nr:hypothetical protein [Phycisphaerae bacterium]HRW53887.1 hypothetical protein [Phycisphaerae bacterium]
MDFRNTTHVDNDELLSAIHDAIEMWPSEKLIVRVRYSRGAEFSGACYYASNRIFVNLGRQNRYPYRLLTHIARPSANRTHWWRELYSVEIASPMQLVLFVFLHEFYHWLVKQARRNVRQKEGRCDRFATRVLVDSYGAQVRDSHGRPVPRESWDFQDLNGFVAAALRKRPVRITQPLLLPGAAATKPVRPKATSGNNECAA